MNITELIKKLEAIRNEHGDLEVYTYDLRVYRTESMGIIPLPEISPEVVHRKILKDRESITTTWHPSHGVDRKGEKVVSF